MDVDVYLCSELSGDGEKNLKDIDKVVDILLNNKVPQTLTKRLVHDHFFYRKTFFIYNKCVVKRIFSFLVSAFLIFVPIVSVSIISSPINFDQNEISVTLNPENVHTNDTMFVNVSVPSSLDIISVVADFGSLETVVLSLLENNSYINLWQASWLVPDVDEGNYVVAITLINVTNGSCVFGKTWSILPDELKDCNNNSDGMMNETNNQVDQSINQSVEDENDVEVPTNNSIVNSFESAKSNGSTPDIVNVNTSEYNRSMDSNETKSFFTNTPAPAPTITENPIDSFHKRVTVASDIHYTNVTAFSTIDNRPQSTIHLYHIINGSRMEIDFTSIDLDNDSLVDRIEWTVPHLSEQTYEIVINITKAEHLDKNRVFLSDIYDDVKAKDGRWSEPIYNGEYVRVTFERALEKDNDITIVARSYGTSRIEVYAKNNESLIATFENITGEHRYQILLTNLSDSQTTFDLRTSGDAVEYEYIVDPTGWISPTGFADPSNQWTDETRAYDDNTGSYASHTGAVGWRGFLQLNLSSAIYCDRVRVFSDFGGGVVDQVDVDIYNSTSWIDKYNGTIANDAWTELSFGAETNVTKARFRYHYTANGWVFWFYEFDFWQGQPLTLPNGTTFNATSIDETSAILNGNVSDDGGEPCEYRFQYGSDSSYGNNTTWGGSEVKNSNFGTMIHNLTIGHTYQYRVQVRNSIGTVNGSNKNFTTATLSLGWVTPTNHNDPNSQWENENKIYDDDTDTYARSFHDANDLDGQWSFYIYVNHSVLLCDKVRFYAKGPTGDTVQIDQADLDVKKGGVWVDVYQGTFSDRQWVEKSFTQGSVSEGRIRFHVNVNNGGLYYELYEFDFNKSRPVPMITNEGPANRSWGITLRPQMNITVNNPDGASMTISWSSNSSGSWQVFGTNSSIGNGTYHQRNNNFSNNNTKYWWKVSVTDGTDMNTSWYSFSTPDIIKPSSNVVAITPYWKKTSPLTITATASDTGWSGLKNVTLYYRFSNNNASWSSWVSAGVDTAAPWSWSFAFSNGSGFYQFYSIAKDNATNAEAAPGSADAWCGYDNLAPTSSVNVISTPYWKNLAATITATASDATSGTKNVTLYYRFSNNNASWSSWVSAGVDTAAPWSWSFAFSNGSGFYQFYSIAKDNATNAEAAPGSADAWCGYDNLAPTSSVNVISTPYWKNTNPLTITATASHINGSGLKNVTLYYYNSSNNNTWYGPWNFGVDSDPWVAISWSFTFPKSVGFYRFYSIAADNASIIEASPLINDTHCGYDDQPPACTITYNRSATYFKANDSLRIYAIFNEIHSGINESSVIITISTIGNGSLNNVSMNMIDNTHWYYDWTIPSGSDDDGLFNVSIYANDNAHNTIDPYPTTDSSKQIDNTAPNISSLSVSNISSSSVTINWITNENTTSHIAYGATFSYGLWSNHSESVTSHSYPLTGLSSNSIYHYQVISYDQASNQNISSDNTFTTSSEPQTPISRPAIHNIIQNKPPKNPTIEGPTTGHINTEYNFTVRSTDANNDTIEYTFNWGDGITELSGFLPNGINCIKNHSWTKAGKYTIKVTASDTRTSSSSEKTVWIDAVAISDLGYLLDSDSDGIFDSFHNVATGEETLTEMKNGIYLIDLDGDHQWDYEYNSSSGMIALINQQPSMTEAKPQFPVLWVGGLIFAGGIRNNFISQTTSKR